VPAESYIKKRLDIGGWNFKKNLEILNDLGTVIFAV
jgi:hypothetical protein